MEYLFFAFVCKLAVELIFKLAKKAYRHFKTKKESSATTPDSK